MIRDSSSSTSADTIGRCTYRRRARGFLLDATRRFTVFSQFAIIDVTSEFERLASLNAEIPHLNGMCSRGLNQYAGCEDSGSIGHSEIAPLSNSEVLGPALVRI
jgi:hypothetical protein